MKTMSWNLGNGSKVEIKVFARVALVNSEVILDGVSSGIRSEELIEDVKTIATLDGQEISPKLQVLPRNKEGIYAALGLKIALDKNKFDEILALEKEALNEARKEFSLTYNIREENVKCLEDIDELEAKIYEIM